MVLPPCFALLGEPGDRYARHLVYEDGAVFRRETLTAGRCGTAPYVLNAYLTPDDARRALILLELF